MEIRDAENNRVKLKMIREFIKKKDFRESGKFVAPRDGKPFPKDTKSNDLWHWLVSFETTQAKSLAETKGKFDFISSGLVGFGGNNFGFKQALLVCDVDGHPVRIVGQ